MMRAELFDYDLPPELVAAVPAERRTESRLMVLDRESGCVEHRRFSDLPRLLQASDMLVMNDARVIPARLSARRRTGGRVGLLLVHPEAGERWLALARSSGSLRPGEVLTLRESGARVELVEELGGGRWTVRLPDGGAEAAMREGAVPLPPYVLKARRERGMPARMPELDRERYQTVYADRPGAVAAPTAGLHFTPELLEELRRSGVEVHMLSLLVGPGTFCPVRSERVEEHHLDAERFHLPAETARAVQSALEEGCRIVATGTTTCRVLEHAGRQGAWEEQEGWTDLYIHPPFEFRVVGALITNFHLPRSTLLMLVSAFAGREQVLAAYEEAVRQRYRFYSYGDAMLIL